MRKVIYAGIPFLFLTSFATAQSVDPQHIVNALQRQRNDAMDQAAAAEAKANQLAAEITKLREELKNAVKPNPKSDDPAPGPGN